MRRKTIILIIIDMIILLLLAGVLLMCAYWTKSQADEVTLHEQGTAVEKKGIWQTITSQSHKMKWKGDISLVDDGDNVFTITWTASSGAEYYEVRRYDADADEWQDVLRVDVDDDYTYTTDRLPAYSEQSYKISAFNQYGNSSDSETVYCQAKECVAGSIVWPMKDLTAYADSEMSSKVGTVVTLQAYRATGIENGMFGIEVDGATWYIDSNYCMINLNDFIGELCLYDITNSYASYYTIHDYDIPNVTWTVVEGYENVKQSDGSYLVPLLYPTALKLIVAAQSASEYGYKIKIYDSYRPNCASKSIYKLTAAILDDKIEQLGDGTTYRSMMLGTSGRYSLNSFLAKNYSTHNYGIAMDLTFVDAETGIEIAMQTSMHDLSHYAAVSENNKNSNLLRDVMVGAGFGTLSTEWWHFQDDDTRSHLSLSPQTNGVKGL